MAYLSNKLLTKVEQTTLLLQLDQWEINEAATEIYKYFKFKNFYETMAFINAVAWIAHQQDHHPYIEISYNHCLIRYTTHALNGLSQNDFVCATKIDALISGG